MALPPRAAAYYVYLSQTNTTPTTPRTTGTLLESFVDIPYDPSQPSTWPRPPTQPSFYASQQWGTNYPEECVAKVHLGLDSAAINWPTRYEPGISSGNNLYIDSYSNNVEIDATYPTNIIGSYDPTPAPGPAESAPNPNGTVGTSTPTVSGPNGPGIFYLPRWYLDTAYDVGNDQFGVGLFCPEFDTEYFIQPNGIITGGIYGQQVGAWSVDLTVDNYQSEVLNEQTNLYEYYDFTQLTFDYKQTTTLKLYIAANICCWNKGTVINGTILFQSITVDTTALGKNLAGNIDPSYNYNFAGMIAKTGSSASPSGTQSFSVTVESSYVPIEVEVPTLAGSFTFVNDFRIDSVTPPA